MRVAQPSVRVCFVRVQGNPIVSGIEVRPLPATAYCGAGSSAALCPPASSRVMRMLWWRISSGGDADISSYR